MRQIRFTCKECKKVGSGVVVDLLTHITYCQSCWKRHLTRLQHVRYMAATFDDNPRFAEMVSYIHFRNTYETQPPVWNGKGYDYPGPYYQYPSWHPLMEV